MMRAKSRRTREPCCEQSKSSWQNCHSDFSVAEFCIAGKEWARGVQTLSFAPALAPCPMSPVTLPLFMGPVTQHSLKEPHYKCQQKVRLHRPRPPALFFGTQNSNGQVSSSVCRVFGTLSVKIHTHTHTHSKTRWLPILTLG